MSADYIDAKNLQEDLNKFTKKFLKGLAPLHVDGKPGHATKGRIKTVKYHLGYHRPINDTPDHKFRMRMRYPRKRKYSTAARMALGMRRRIASRARWAKNVAHAHVSNGVTFYDGRPVAAWMVPYMEWARTHNVNGRKWQGGLMSGFREPAYSEHLCKIMCGAPTCSGRCAGRGSGHSQKIKPRGCLDVTDFQHFREAMRACPLRPQLINDLPIDRVHFSTSGH